MDEKGTPQRRWAAWVYIVCLVASIAGFFATVLLWSFLLQPLLLH